MSRRGPTGARAAASNGAAVLALVAFGGLAQPSVAAAQEESPAITPEQLMTMTDAELEQLGIRAGYQSRDLPYAMLVDSLFEMLVLWDNGADLWLSNRGLDPESTAARELKALATEVEVSYPSDPQTATLGPDVDADDETRNAWVRDQQDRRYRALGVAFGGWLESRRAEGYPPEFYLDRLLAPVTSMVVATESMEELESWKARAAREFEVGLRQVMTTLPHQLEVGAGEGG